MMCRYGKSMSHGGGPNMVPVALSDVIAVGEVPTADEISILAKAGFRSLLNTQPDGEVDRLMKSAEAGELAAKAGMAYRHVPIESRRPPGTAIDAFDEALRTLPRPIYACCYSGARTAAAWALAAARHDNPDSVIDACTKAGYDMSFMKPYLETRFAEAKAKASAPQVQSGESSVAPPPPAQAAAAPGFVPAADPLKSNGSSARAPAEPLAVASETVPKLEKEVPSLVPSILPRAASAGGFAVSG